MNKTETDYQISKFIDVYAKLDLEAIELIKVITNTINNFYTTNDYQSYVKYIVKIRTDLKGLIMKSSRIHSFYDYSIEKLHANATQYIFSPSTKFSKSDGELIKSMITMSNQ